VQNCQCISKSARKISRKLSLVILFLSYMRIHLHTGCCGRPLLTLKAWKKPLRFVVWTFSLELQIINLWLIKKKKTFWEFALDSFASKLQHALWSWRCTIWPIGTTSYASRIVNVSAVNADARIEALGKAAWYRDISIIGSVETKW